MCQISRKLEYVFAFYSKFCKCAKTRRRIRRKTKKKTRNFGCSYLGNGWSDFLQIWNVDSPCWRATLQQIWFLSDKVSPRYKGVKMTFFSFMSLYPQCGALASWAARHTIVCLDVVTRLYKNKEQLDMVERPIHYEKKQVLYILVLSFKCYIWYFL